MPAYYEIREPESSPRHLFDAADVEAGRLDENIKGWTTARVTSECGGVERHGPFVAVDKPWSNADGGAALCGNCRRVVERREADA